jgi:hypothetical protein
LSAYIDFTLNGQSYRYAGEWPEAVAEQIGDAMDDEIAAILNAASSPYKPNDILAPTRAIIERAGGEVTAVAGTRPDGAIRIEDLDDAKLY